MIITSFSVEEKQSVYQCVQEFKGNKQHMHASTGTEAFVHER